MDRHKNMTNNIRESRLRYLDRVCGPVKLHTDRCRICGDAISWSGRKGTSAYKHRPKYCCRCSHIREYSGPKKDLTWKVEKSCISCGSEFVPNKKGQTTCSAKCTRELNRPPLVKPTKFGIAVTEKDISRFWSHVNKQGPKITYVRGRCWVWTASTSEGYGQFKVGSLRINAHRFSWIIAKDKIPNGKSVLHKCDNPACIRPTHLFLGTTADNTADMIAKGRQKTVKGRPSHKRIPVVIDGKKYVSISHAAKALGIAWQDAKQLSLGP